MTPKNPPGLGWVCFPVGFLVFLGILNYFFLLGTSELLTMRPRCLGPALHHPFTKSNIGLGILGHGYQGPVGEPEMAPLPWDVFLENSPAPGYGQAPTVSGPNLAVFGRFRPFSAVFGRFRPFNSVGGGKWPFQKKDIILELWCISQAFSSYFQLFWWFWMFW